MRIISIILLFSSTVFQTFVVNFIFSRFPNVLAKLNFSAEFSECFAELPTNPLIYIGDLQDLCKTKSL